MFKYKVTAFILLAALFITKGYCQQVVKDQQIMTVAGKVTYVDTAGSVIGVQTEKGRAMVFNATTESELLRYAHHMASIEIEKGDPVIVQYEISPFGKNTIIRLVDKKPDTD